MGNVLGEGNGYENRVFILYSGVHYDAIALSPMESNHVDAFDQTSFPVDGGNAIVEKIKELVKIRNDLHEFTDMATFTLTCNICKSHLNGERDAREHASKTGHVDFVEYAK